MRHNRVHLRIQSRHGHDEKAEHGGQRGENEKAEQFADHVQVPEATAVMEGSNANRLTTATAGFAP